MTATIRRHHLKWLKTVAYLAWPVAMVLAVVIVIVIDRSRTPLARALSQVAALLMFSGWVLIPLVLLLRWVLARRFDLNDPGLDTSRWTDGAPQPIGHEQTTPSFVAAQDGASLLTARAARFEPTDRPWIRVQPLTWKTSEVCCCCRAPDTLRYKVEVKTGCELDVILCQPCRQFIKRRRRRLAMTAALLLTVVIELFFWPFPYPTIELIRATFVLAFSLLITYCIAAEFTSPIQTRRFRKHDNTVEIRSRYTISAVDRS